MQSHPEDLTNQDFGNLTNIHNSAEKDIAVSYVEGQILIPLGYRWAEAPYGSYPPIWNNYLTHFYKSAEEVRIKKYGESLNFDIYCASRDTIFIDSVKIWLEETRQYYIDTFQVEINHRSHICIFSQEVGAILTQSSDFNGGSGAINISPYDFYDGFEGYPFLIAHEFGHVYNDLMYHDFPYGFYHEGMANFSAFLQHNSDWDDGIWKIEPVLYFYNQNYGREPTLDDFINNPYEPEGGSIDPYYFGLEFIRYLYETEGILKIQQFFNNGLDFTVFNQSYQEIESEYIKRVKRKAHLYPSVQVIDIPFEESFDDFENGWTKPSYANYDNWRISDGGTNGSNCARFYTNSDKNEEIESLVSLTSI